MRCGRLAHLTIFYSKQFLVISNGATIFTVVDDSASFAVTLKNNSDNIELSTHFVEQLTWEAFVDLLEIICKVKGWDVEYEEYSDRSIAIFAE